MDLGSLAILMNPQPQVLASLGLPCHPQGRDENVISLSLRSTLASWNAYQQALLACRRSSIREIFFPRFSSTTMATESLIRNITHQCLHGEVLLVFSTC